MRIRCRYVSRSGEIVQIISKKQKLEITFFVPDDRKTVEEYMTVTGSVRPVDDQNREIVFVDGMTVGIDDVWKIRIILN